MNTTVSTRLTAAIGLWLFVFAGAAGCGGARLVEPAPPKREREVSRLVERAIDLERRSDPFTASCYYEAALASGADERRVLPRLAITQARSGRLIEARMTLRRYLAIASSGAEAERLRAVLLDLLAGGARAESAREGGI